MKQISFLLMVLLGFGLGRPIPAQVPKGADGDPKAAILHARFEARLRGLADKFDGVLGVAIKDLTTGESFLLNEQATFPQASSIKIAVLLELLRQAEAGALRLTDPHTVRRSEVVAGGILDRLGDGTTTLSLRDLAVLMIVLSDNSATNILIERLGMARIQETLNGLGLQRTLLRRKMIDLEAARRGQENVSTPLEMMTLLERVERGAVLGAAGRADFFSILELPKQSAMRRQLPAGVTVADKPGSLEGVRTVTALVRLKGRPYLFVANTTYAADEEAAEQLIAELARAAYDYFLRLARSSPYGRAIQ